MENMNREELEIELAEVKLEIKYTEQPRLSQILVEDVDEAYQKCLEYGHWINGMNERIDDINLALNTLDNGP